MQVSKQVGPQTLALPALQFRGPRERLAGCAVLAEAGTCRV